MGRDMHEIYDDGRQINYLLTLQPNGRFIFNARIILKHNLDRKKLISININKTVAFHQYYFMKD